MEPRPGSESGEDAEPSTAADAEPRHCVLLRAGGQMSVLDMAQGLPLRLTTSLPTLHASMCAQQT